MKTSKSILCFLIFSLLSYSGFSQNRSVEPIDLSNKRELFIDHYLIETLKGVQISKQIPHDEGPVLSFDKPWEGVFCGYCTIIKDGDLFRSYYRGLPTDGKDGSNIETTCMAESKDGIHWVKPILKIYKIGKSRRNNVILANEAPSSHNFSPFLDKNPNTDPSQRYKALAGEDKVGLRAYVSPDGIHWKKLQEKVQSRDLRIS